MKNINIKSNIRDKIHDDCMSKKMLSRNFAELKVRVKIEDGLWINIALNISVPINNEIVLVLEE